MLQNQKYGYAREAEALLDSKSQELYLKNQENKYKSRERIRREREARKEAEALLEQKSSELFEAYQNLEEKSKSRLKRERTARKEAEALLESKSKELWQAYEENARLGTELQITRQLQEMVLPGAMEFQAIHSLDISAYMNPAHEVGGDYYDVLPYHGGVKIGIGDVTDHGLESGVIMLMAQTAIRTLLNSGEQDPVRFLDIINRTIFENVQRMQTDRNLTLSLLDYQRDGEATGELRLSGQHEEVVVIRNNLDFEIIETDNLGFPIGLDDQVGHLFDYTTLELQDGDGVVLFTDGITEAEKADGEHFGLGRLCQTARKHWSQPAEAVKDAIIAELTTYIDGHEVYDDITLMVIKQR